MNSLLVCIAKQLFIYAHISGYMVKSIESSERLRGRHVQGLEANR